MASANVQWIESAGVFEVRWREGSRQKSKTFNPKKFRSHEHAERAAERHCAEIVAKLDAGRPILRRKDVPTLTEAFKSMLALKIQLGKLRPRTQREYATVWATHVDPHVGYLPVIDCTGPVLMGWQKARLDAEAGRRRIAMAGALIHQSMKWALKNGHLEINHAQVLDAPEQEPLEIEPASPEQVEQLRKWFIDKGRIGDALVISLMAYAGLRPYGETFALRSDSLSGRMLSIVRVLEPVMRKDGTWEIQTRPGTKTGHKRVLEIPSLLVTEIQAWWLSRGRPDGLLIPRADGGPWREHDYYNWVEDWFGPACEAVGLRTREAPILDKHGNVIKKGELIKRFSPYGLRHTCASTRAMAGDRLPEVAGYLGHSVTMCARAYTHVVDAMKGQPSRTPDEVIGEARQTVFGELETGAAV